MRYASTVAGSASEDTGRAGSPSDNSQQDLDQCGFTGSVGTEQTEDFARLDGKRDSPQSLNLFPADDPAAIGFMQVLDGHDR